jgi:nucleoside-diphosphate-sugar epimerase
VDVLITGGNGFVGRHLVRALIKRGDRVRVLALPDEDTTWLNRRGVEVFRGDVCVPATIAPAMRGIDAVLHLAAMMHVWRSLREYCAVNVSGTEYVCRAALAAGVHRFVHMSSTSVYGTPRTGRFDETSPVAPFDDPYPMSKAAGDVVVRRMYKEDGLRAVIVRPDQIFGPGDRLHFGNTAAQLRKGRAIVVGRGDNATPLVYVDNIVDGLLLAMDRVGIDGEVFNITNDDRITQLEYLDAISDAIGAEPRRLHVPYQVLAAAAVAAEGVARVRRSSTRPAITRLGVAFTGGDVRSSISKARNELGYAPRVSLRVGIRRTASWWRAESERTPRRDMTCA